MTRPSRTLGHQSDEPDSIATYVRDKIVTMKQKVESRNAGGQGTMDVSLISASSLPVWKMLSLAANMPGGDFVVENHTQLVAVDVAHSYFTNLAKTLREAVQNEMGKGNADVAEAAKSILSRVTEIEQEGREMLVAEYQKGVQVAQMQRSIQWLDQSLKAGLPTNVFQSMMAFNRYRDSATDYEALSVQRNAPRWIKALTKFGFIATASS